MAATLFEAASQRFMRLVARAVAASRFRTICAGMEAIPAAGPCVIAARHYHHFYDGVALFAANLRPFHIIVTLDWAESRMARTVMAQLTRAARWPALLRPDAVRRARRDGSAAFSIEDALHYRRRAFRDAIELLAEGRILVIFPEGYPAIDPRRAPDTAAQEFLPFKSGLLRIVRAAEKRLAREIPILPAGIHYSAGRPSTVYLRFGPSVDRTTFDGPRLIARLEQEVRRLSAPPIDKAADPNHSASR